MFDRRRRRLRNSSWHKSCCWHGSVSPSVRMECRISSKIRRVFFFLRVCRTGGRRSSRQRRLYQQLISLSRQRTRDEEYRLCRFVRTLWHVDFSPEDFHERDAGLPRVRQDESMSFARDFSLRINVIEDNYQVKRTLLIRFICFEFDICSDFWKLVYK